MSTPVYESSVESLESLDFAIPCSGFMSANLKDMHYCFNPALFIFSHNCGCEAFKCADCSSGWLKVAAELESMYGSSVGICMGCWGMRDDSQVIIRPI